MPGIDDPTRDHAQQLMAREMLSRAQAAQAAINEILAAAGGGAMYALYDNLPVKLTPRYIGALLELLRAEVEMMDAQPGHEGSWWWGRCTITDLARLDGLEMEFGDRASLPGDGRGRFAVVSNFDAWFAKWQPTTDFTPSEAIAWLVDRAMHGYEFPPKSQKGAEL